MNRENGAARSRATGGATVLSELPAIPLRPLSVWATLAWLLAVALVLRAMLVVSTLLFPSLGNHLLWLAFVEWLCFGGCSWLLLRGVPPARVAPALGAVGGLRTLLLGALIGIAIHPFADGVRAATEQLVPSPEAERVAQEALLAPDSASQMLLLIVALGVLGPAAEELFYRGALFARARSGLGTLHCVLLTSAGFAVGHPSARDWPALLVVALLLAWVRLRSQSLLGAVAAHATFNCATLLSVWGNATLPGRLSDYGLVAWSLVVASVLACSLLLRWLGGAGVPYATESR